MRLWPFHSRDPNPIDPDLLAAKIQADLDHKQAIQDLEHARTIASEMRKVRERNHVGQSLQALYDGKTA